MSAEITDVALFSYGTLQNARVQLDTFGRIVSGRDDNLPGFRIDYIDIDDPQVIALRGSDRQPILRRTGSPLDRVFGRLMWITIDELDAADEYELPPYRRVPVELASHTSAWAYGWA